MTIVTEEKYNQIKQDFYQAHGKVDQERTTSSGSNHIKQVNFVDGAIWYETSHVIHEPITGEVHGVPYSFIVLLVETEFWYTDNGDPQAISESAYMYTKATKENM